MIYPISGYFCDIPKWIQMDLCFLNKVWGINFARLNIFINLPPILQVTNWIYYCCCNNNFDKTVSFSLFISILGLSRTSRRPWACGTWRITCRYKIVLCFVKKKKKSDHRQSIVSHQTVQDLRTVLMTPESFKAVRVSCVKICFHGRLRLFSESLTEMQTLMRHVGVWDAHRAKHVCYLGFLLFLLLTYRINVFTCCKPVIVDSVLMSRIAT